MGIPYGHQHIDEEDIKAVTNVLRSDFLTQGPTIAQFEKKLTAYCTVPYATVFSSGTAALHAAYFAAGLKKGDDFVTTPLTFVATANAGLYLGARPVFADISEDGNLDPVLAEKKMTKKTKLLAVVDYAGNPADLNSFRRVAKRHGVVVVEDACQALGASYKGKKIGSLSDMTAFSFHPVKSITTGEGGAVLTDNPDFDRKLKLFRTHGMVKNGARLEKNAPGEWYCEMQELGFNYRMTDMQAALGISQLAKLDRFISVRKEIAARYTEAFSAYPDLLSVPHERRGCSSAWHLYPIRLTGKAAGRRAEVFGKLREAGIGVQVHHIPVYRHPFYETSGYQKGSCPTAERFYHTVMSLPLFPDLTLAQQELVIKKLSALIRS